MTRTDIERTARIFNIQKYSVYDGPGVRTLVFFKGCPLRCKWCANPEGLHRKYEVMYKRMSCIDCGKCTEVCPVDIHQMIGQKHEVRRDIECIGCRKCEDICPQRALQIMGEDKTISELIEIIEEDREFYQVSGGGLTLGGGEVTAQADAATSLLSAAKNQGFHTAIETCGYTPKDDMKKIANFVDLFLYDLKFIEPVRHKELTGVNNERIIENLKMLLELGKDVKIRMPILQGVNDHKEQIQAIIDLLSPYKYYKNFKGIDLLPYHKLGVGKYDQLDLEYPIKEEVSVSEETLDKIETWIKEADLEINIIRH